MLHLIHAAYKWSHCDRLLRLAVNYTRNILCKIVPDIIKSFMLERERQRKYYESVCRNLNKGDQCNKFLFPVMFYSQENVECLGLVIVNQPP